ncbi:hypothetical protein B0H34DRAFT_623302, partial [Crassisporium funariophilum]
LKNSKFVTASKQLSIFLHFARTGSSSRMLQERFQRSGSTISQSVYIRKLTKILAGRFYRKYVQLMPDEIPAEIRNNPKLSPYFDECRGTMDGVQF